MERAWDVGVAHRGAHDLATLWGGVVGTWQLDAGEEGHGMIAALATTVVGHHPIAAFAITIPH